MLSIGKLLIPAKCWIKLVRLYKVAVMGGASELGQTVALLLRGEPAVSALTVHDAAPLLNGVLTDLSHIPTESTLKGYRGEENLLKALSECDLVLSTGGTFDPPGTFSHDTAMTNMDSIKVLASMISRVRPMPFIGIATEPINMFVPMIAEIMKYSGDYDPRKLFGITASDSLKAQAMYAELHNLDPRQCIVPVICGHSANTIVPLLSHAQPYRKMDGRRVRAFIHRLRQLEGDIVDKKCGSGAILSTAYSVLLFTRGIINALDGKMTPSLNVFIENNDFGTSYFGGRVFVNQYGAGEMERYTDLTNYECEMLEKSITELRKEVSFGKRMIETD